MGIEIIIVVIITIVSTYLHRKRAKQRVDRNLSTWAQMLGMVRFGNELLGRLHGVPVGARLAFDVPKDRSHRHAMWTLYARLQPPLDLGLNVHTTGFEIDMPKAGQTVVSTGDWHFDLQFQTHADEPPRALALLTDSLRRKLTSRVQQGAMFLLTDHGVAVQIAEARLTQQTLSQGLELVSRIAAKVNASRGEVHVAGPLAAMQPAWARFAGRNALHGISAPLCMWGSIEGATVYAYSVRTAAFKYCLEVWLRFDEPLGLGLLVQPLRTVDRVKDMFGTVDFKLGDPLFDETFLVCVSDPDGVKRLLNEDTRERVLNIHGTVGPLSLTDDGLSIRMPHVPPDPAVVPNIVRQMLELARYISDLRRGHRAAGPYR